MTQIVEYRNIFFLVIVLPTDYDRASRALKSRGNVCVLTNVVHLRSRKLGSFMLFLLARKNRGEITAVQECF